MATGRDQRGYEVLGKVGALGVGEGRGWGKVESDVRSGGWPESTAAAYGGRAWKEVDTNLLPQWTGERLPTSLCKKRRSHLFVVRPWDCNFHVTI